MNKRQRKKAAKYWFVRELRKRYRREALVVQRYMARVYRDGWPPAQATSGPQPIDVWCILTTM